MTNRAAARIRVNEKLAFEILTAGLCTSSAVAESTDRHTRGSSREGVCSSEVRGEGRNQGIEWLLDPLYQWGKHLPVALPPLIPDGTATIRRASSRHRNSAAGRILKRVNLLICSWTRHD
jgi:hypothetical protein